MSDVELVVPAETDAPEPVSNGDPDVARPDHNPHTNNQLSVGLIVKT